MSMHEKNQAIGKFITTTAKQRAQQAQHETDHQQEPYAYRDKEGLFLVYCSEGSTG